MREYETAVVSHGQPPLFSYRPFTKGTLKQGSGIITVKILCWLLRLATIGQWPDIIGDNNYQPNMLKNLLLLTSKQGLQVCCGRIHKRNKLRSGYYIWWIDGLRIDGSRGEHIPQLIGDVISIVVYLIYFNNNNNKTRHTLDTLTSSLKYPRTIPDLLRSVIYVITMTIEGKVSRRRHHT